MNNRSFIKLLLLLFALPSLAQTARVIQIDPVDTSEVKSLYAQQKAIEQKIANLHEQLRQKYTVVLEGDKDAGNMAISATITSGLFITIGCALSLNSDPAAEKAARECEDKMEAEREKKPKPIYHYYRRGWETGFVFSEDFRFIVPQESPKYTPSYNSMLNCIVPTGTSNTFVPISAQ